MSRITSLAVNEEGFVFDPTSGDSYVTNATGMLILQGLRRGDDEEKLASSLATQFEVEPTVAWRDVTDFLSRLRLMNLL